MGVVFHEVNQVRATDAGRFVRRVVPADRGRTRSGRGGGWPSRRTAPYSVAPSVYRALARQAPSARGEDVRPRGRVAGKRWSSSAGSGGWPELLKRLGAWDPNWRAPQCSPVEYLERLAFWDEGTLAVHAVQAGHEESGGAARRRRHGVTCPRSNAWVGAACRQPRLLPVRRPVGHRDGAAWPTWPESEPSASSRAAPHRARGEARRPVPQRDALGREALGFVESHGAISPGAGAALIAVEVPPGTADVEQYLVSVWARTGPLDQRVRFSFRVTYPAC